MVPNEYVKKISENIKEKNWRPVVILKVYKSNVIYMPITSKKNEEKTHFKINSFSKKFEDSFIKLSVILTMPLDEFRKKTMPFKPFYSIGLNEWEKIAKELSDFLHLNINK